MKKAKSLFTAVPFIDNGSVEREYSSRREFFKISAAALGATVFSHPLILSAAEETPIGYRRASTDWMADSKFGISTHWTTQSMPMKGESGSFKEAVEQFDVARFIAQIDEMGADYLIFTPNHAEFFFPGPVLEVEAILPGRAMARDLIREIGEALKKRGKHFILYYNLGYDKEWQTAMQYYHPSDFEPYIANLCRVVGAISSRYAGILDGWWFDCGYCLESTRKDTRLTAPSVKEKKYRFPWERLTAAAKKGSDAMLVSISPGANIEDFFIYTDHQDYWHGERGYFPADRNMQARVPLSKVCPLPASRYCPNGLQWHTWTCLDNRSWVHLNKDTPAADPIYTKQEVQDFVDICREKKAAVTFNVEIFREGIISEKAVKFLAGIK
jgi:hypothetical protein